MTRAAAFEDWVVFDQTMGLLFELLTEKRAAKGDSPRWFDFLTFNVDCILPGSFMIWD